MLLGTVGAADESCVGVPESEHAAIANIKPEASVRATALRSAMIENTAATYRLLGGEVSNGSAICEQVGTHGPLAWLTVALVAAEHPINAINIGLAGLASSGIQHFIGH